MKVHATYSQGSFHPTEPVNLPENCQVELEARKINGRRRPSASPRPKRSPAKKKPTLEDIYAHMDFRFDGPGDLAARHNEHQP